MKNKKQILTTAFTLLGLGSVFAQESPVNAGGEATGSGGTASYSVGQVAYTSNTGSSGSVAQGVQQAYTITTTLGTDHHNISLESVVYPNPTTDFVILKVKESEAKKWSYQLWDSQGRLLQEKKLSGAETQINLQNQPSSLYIISVLENNKALKTFKIIKK